MSYRNNDYYMTRFARMTPDEAYVLVMTNIRRMGYKEEFDCAKKAFAVAYDGLEFMSPEERKHKDMEKRIAELEAREAAPKEPETFIVKDEIVFTEPTRQLTKDEFKANFAKEHGYGGSTEMSKPDNLAFGRAWKKYNKE